MFQHLSPEYKIEPYLVNEYGVIEDVKGLTSEDDIENYFMDCGSEYFDCGQGYYEDEVELIVKIGYRFFNVHIYAEVWGDKQDHGDKLYYVEKIMSVTHEEIPKPEPKTKQTVILNVTAPEYDIERLISYLNEHKAISWWEMQIPGTEDVSNGN